ncbi:NUDIX domain-containing protein [Microbacterium kribbense]|uniref:NUDIX domain-containing protein n=1 Tax=Microbacterium kribbense TaxID=433645 RepID=A0ABP7G741_9MICO
MTSSAGLLLHRRTGDGLEVLIAHMGGPFWARKDEAAWSIPKGEFDPAVETAMDAAAREFREELGVDPPAGPYVELGMWTYSSGKKVTVFAADGAGLPACAFSYGTFEMEWPPHSGRRAAFPEVDRAEWMGVEPARPRLVKGQRAALDALVNSL